MISLRNDYCTIAHPKVLEKMTQLNGKIFTGYGLDEVSASAKKMIQERLDDFTVDIHFLVGGTITNKVLLSHILRPYEAVIACDTAHINVHETGTIEQAGHKIIITPNQNGKLNPDDILDVLSSHTDEHMVKPKLVYITNATETGTVYSYSEIKEISDICKKNNLYLYLDGARLFTALTSDYNDIKFSDLPKLVDAFYIGGTKNGAMLGEALVICNEQMKEEIRYSIKHFGGMYSKGFISGIQFLALFEADLISEICKMQNTLAKNLYLKLQEMGVEFFSEQQTNQIFPMFDTNIISKLQEKIDFEVWGKKDNKTIIRFVTHSAVCDEDIDEVIEIIKKII